MYADREKREKGKITEFKVISELIQRGFDLYTPIIDTGIDCILRIEKRGEPTKYYELQIKSSLKNVSIRGAKRILEYINEKQPDNYFLIIAIREEEDIKHIVYLTKEQIGKFAYPSPKADEIDINIKAKERDELINSQSLEKLIRKLKAG